MEELDDMMLRETDFHIKFSGNTMSGNEEDAMEYLENLRSTSLYAYACSESSHCNHFFSHVKE